MASSSHTLIRLRFGGLLLAPSPPPLVQEELLSTCWGPCPWRATELLRGLLPALCVFLFPPIYF